MNENHNPHLDGIVIYPSSILNSAQISIPISHSDVFDVFLFHTLTFPMFFDIFQCFPYSNVFLFHTPTFPMFPAVFQHLSALWCFPYFNVSKILLFHSIPSPYSDVFRCFPYFYRCRTFSVTSWTHFLKHHNLGSIMDSLWMQ